MNCPHVKNAEEPTTNHTADSSWLPAVAAASPIAGPIEIGPSESEDRTPPSPFVFLCDDEDIAAAERYLGL